MSVLSGPSRLLFIAGSDSCGGAGIQADVKTATVLGAYAMTAITAITAQDTAAVHAMQLVSPDIVRAQIASCLDDIGADAIKIGMLGSGAIAAAVADALAAFADVPIVLDPVLASTSGTPLLDEAGIGVLRARLIPMAAVVTPNIPEAGRLTEIICDNPDGIARAGDALLSLGARAVVIKGGHGADDVLTDTLMERGKPARSFSHARQDTAHTHGTGCTYAAAIAVGLAKRRPLPEAVLAARRYVQEALSRAPGFGAGRGPLNHMVARGAGDAGE